MPFSKGSSSTVKLHVTSRLRQSDKHHKHLSHTTYTTKLQLVKCNKHGFNNRNGQRTGKEANYRFYGPTGVGPMVKPMMS